ncbi:MAG: hypothetical protein E7220_00830 [Clostridiales bacterium]|nr:hypothetical protein [Clostridiales bacterium]
MQGSDRKYEQLYDLLYARTEAMHEANKKRIRLGLIWLAVLPVLLCLIIWITHSDKIVFLLIWVLIMFASCIYLISVEYADHKIIQGLNELTDREAEFDRLILGTEGIHDKVQERVQGRLVEIREGIASRRENLGNIANKQSSDKEAPVQDAETAVKDKESTLQVKETAARVRETAGNDINNGTVSPESAKSEELLLDEATFKQFLNMIDNESEPLISGELAEKLADDLAGGTAEGSADGKGGGSQ